MKSRVCAIKWSPGDGSIWQTAMIRHVAHRRRHNSISVFCRLPKSMQMPSEGGIPFWPDFLLTKCVFERWPRGDRFLQHPLRQLLYFTLYGAGRQRKTQRCWSACYAYQSARAAISTERNYSGQPLREKSGLYLCAGQWCFWPRAFSLLACQVLRSRLGMKVLNASAWNKAHC